MRVKPKFVSIFVLILCLFPLVDALDFYPFGNVQMENYSIIGGYDVNATNFYQDGVLVVSDNQSWNESYADSLYASISVTEDNTSWNESYADTLYIGQSDESNLNVNSSTYWDSETNQSNLNVNSSNYWDDINTYNTSELDTDGNGNLGILDSFINSLIDARVIMGFVQSLGFYNTTQVDAEIVSANTSMKNYVDVQDSSLNTSLRNYTDSQDVVFNDSMKTYVDAQDETYNDSIKSYADNTFITQANEGNLNVNGSDYWDAYDVAGDINVGDLNDDGTYALSVELDSVNSTVQENVDGIDSLNTIIISNDGELNDIRTDFANKSADETVTGNYIFSPSANVTYSGSGTVEYYIPVYFRNSTYIADSQTLNVNGSIKVQDIAGNYISNLTDDGSGNGILELFDTSLVRDIFLNTAGQSIFNNALYASQLLSDDWSNVTITESQISDLTHFTGADITGSETAFDGWDKDASNDFDGAYSSLTGTPENLSQFTDDLGDRGYTHLSNFTDDLGHIEDNQSWNESYADTLYYSVDNPDSYISDLTSFDTDDLSEGITNLYDNQSWNETYADTLYIAQSSESDLNVNSSEYWDNLNTPADISAGDITDDGTYAIPSDLTGFKNIDQDVNTTSDVTFNDVTISNKISLGTDVCIFYNGTHIMINNNQSGVSCP